MSILRGGATPTAAVLLVAAFLAGCIGADPDHTTDPSNDDLPVTELLARGEPLWHNPQDHPHPAFGWPTLTNPPEDTSDMPEWWQAIEPAALPETITGLNHTTKADEVPSGAGLAIFGRLVVMPGFTTDTHIVDIGDPENPEVLSSFSPAARGAVIIAYPDGRLITVLATSSDLLVFDITDPRDPVSLGGLGPSQGSHKVGVVPGTPIIYNANSAGGNLPDAYVPEMASGVTEIFDLSDPEDPQHVMDFENGYGCHHVYFYNNAETDHYRAYCAGIEVTQIWDTTDPRDPQVVAEIPVHHGDPSLPHTSIPLVAFSHFSIVNQDASVLIVGDETGGGAAPGCDVHVDAMGNTASGPLGNLWFYDISDEANPELLGWMSPTAPTLTDPPVLTDDEPSPNCTAHHGRLVPDPEGERDLLAMAFYGAGVVLIDFTDPTAPMILDQWNPGTDTWEVWHYNGYLITGDLARGMDVLTLR